MNWKTFRSRRVGRAALAGVFGCALTLSLVVGTNSTASAERGDGKYPRPGCKTTDDPLTHRWTFHNQLGRELTAIERKSSGRVRVKQYGETVNGTEMWSARVGYGDKVLMVQSAIHGNERTGTEALLNILWRLGTSNDPATKRTLRNITLVALPMVNPDGGELNRRATVTSWDEIVALHPQLEGASKAWYFYNDQNPTGFDLNRDFNPQLDYEPRARDLPGRPVDGGFYLTPASQAIRDVYVGLQKEFGEPPVFVDLHHAGPCGRLVGGPQDGKLVSVELDYPPLGVNDGAEYEDDWPALDQDMSRRYALAAARGMQDAVVDDQSPLAAVGRYVHFEEREYAGQARSAFALNGSPTVLFEVRGQADHFGQKGMRTFIQAVENGLDGIMDAMTTGEITEIDGDDFFDLAHTGWETQADRDAREKWLDDGSSSDGANLESATARSSDIEKFGASKGDSLALKFSGELGEPTAKTSVQFNDAAVIKCGYAKVSCEVIDGKTLTLSATKPFGNPRDLDDEEVTEVTNLTNTGGDPVTVDDPVEVVAGNG